MSTSNMSPRLPSDAHAKPRWACLGKPSGLGALSGNILTWQPARWPVAHMLAPDMLRRSSRSALPPRPPPSWRPCASSSLVGRRRHGTPENHLAGANKRHGGGADVTRGASGPNDQRAITRDHVNRSRRGHGPRLRAPTGRSAAAWHLEIIRPGPTSAMVRERN